MVLLHGVAFGPETFAPVAALLRRTHRVIVPHRAGYVASASISPNYPDLESEAHHIVQSVQGIQPGPSTIAGVSGGATLALAIGGMFPEAAPRVVAHEPAIGTLGPLLAATLTAAATALTGTPDPDEPALALARGLAGDRTWRGNPAWHATVTHRSTVIAGEVPRFAAFTPPPNMCAALATRELVSSRGRDSGPDRIEVSRQLVEVAGAIELVLPCRHLAQVEAPAALASAITAVAERR